jgi:hypothetical protein
MKLYVVEIEEDITADLSGYYETSSAMMYAENREAIKRELEQKLGSHLIAIHIRKASWRERREYKKTHETCIA